jgi:hypothetical protein
MDTDLLQRHWDRAKSLLRTRWDKLTDADVAHINGNSDRLASRLVDRYGYTHPRARQEAGAFTQEFEQAGETSTEPKSGSVEREASAANPGGVQANHPPRDLSDGVRDAFGGGSVAAGDF